MIQIVGDGLAGSLLARALREKGVSFRQFGDGNTNTPPVGFVHLFQGRTFHRDPVEVVAFRKAIAFWRAEPLALEWDVERWVRPGDRLHRSADTDTVPEEYRPSELGPQHYSYRPGFSVAAQAVVEKARGPELEIKRVDCGKLEGTVVEATGLFIEESFEGIPWDTNPGRTVEAKPEQEPDRMLLYRGCHLAGDPRQPDHLTIGGRVSSKGEAKGDETNLAEEVTGHRVRELNEWWGERMANAIDRWPQVGWLPDGRFLLVGFGGRALFWLPYCVELAVEALERGDNEEIPLSLRADRFQDRLNLK